MSDIVMALNAAEGQLKEALIFVQGAREEYQIVNRELHRCQEKLKEIHALHLATLAGEVSSHQFVFLVGEVLK